MITSFMIYAAVLCVIAALFIFIPFIRKEKGQQLNPNANALRIESYEIRVAELSDEVAMGKLLQSDFDSALIEQKRSLLNELTPLEEQSVKGSGRTFALSAGLFLLSFTLIFYALTGNFTLLQQWQGAKDNLAQLGERAVMNKGEPLTNNEMQQFALGLRTKLAEHGDDEMAWLLLGRVMMSLSDYDMAEQAFVKVIKLNPNNVNALVSYSQALMIEGSEGSVTKAATMLARVLKLEPTNFDAVSLLALIAYERQDWLQAKTAFEMLLERMGPEDSRYGMIQERITQIDREIKQTNTLQQKEDGQRRSLNVTIKLDDALTSELPANATLFVFAKAEQGPGMPLAVVKLQQFTLPKTVTLSNSNAMMSEMTLDKFDRVFVVARISVDENVQAASGELEGTSAVIDITKQSELELTINKRL